MQRLKFGEWEIEVDVEATQAYYGAFTVTDSAFQGYRNYVEFCKNLTDAENAFFESLGISSSCSEVRAIGKTKSRRITTAGIYCFIGRFINKPEVRLMKFDDLKEKRIADNVPDTTVYVDRYAFTFMDPNPFNTEDTSMDAPAEVVHFLFSVENTPWLLKEKPEKALWFPPKPWWIIHKAKNKQRWKERRKKRNLELKTDVMQMLDMHNINYTAMSEFDIARYKRRWFKAIVSKEHQKEARLQCFTDRNFGNGYLWHAFSYEYVPCIHEDSARVQFNHSGHGEAVLVIENSEIGFLLDRADGITADDLEEFYDIVLTGKAFDWVYVHTHEADCGPYYYQQNTEQCE